MIIDVGFVVFVDSCMVLVMMIKAIVTKTFNTKIDEIIDDLGEEESEIE